MGKKIGMVVFVSLFFAVCVLPAFVLLLRGEEQVRANQILIPKPELFGTDGKINIDYFDDFQSYFNSNFAYRQNLVTAHSAILASLLRTSGTETVILGREGWLFYESTADDFLNIASLTERQAANAAITLSLTQEFCRTAGAEFLFLAVPNKNSVYPQFMPPNYIPVNQQGTVEIFTEALNKEGINILNLDEVFRNSEGKLYHKLDSHWNNSGAALAEIKIMEAFGLEGTDYSDYSYRIEKDFPGDLYEMLYPLGTQKDFNTYYSGFSYLTDDGADTGDVNFMAENPEKSGSLVMYRDSFGNALIPFLAQEFGASFFTRAVPYDLNLAVEHGAEFVVLEIAERNLNTLSRRAPVMEAPIRDLPVPESIVNAGLTARVHRNSGYLRVDGGFSSGISDVGARVYAVAVHNENTTVYEAFPIGENSEDGAYTLYLPENMHNNGTFEIALILTCAGEPVLTEYVSLTIDK